MEAHSKDVTTRQRAPSVAEDTESQEGRRRTPSESLQRKHGPANLGSGHPALELWEDACPLPLDTQPGALDQKELP